MGTSTIRSQVIHRYNITMWCSIIYLRSRVRRCDKAIVLVPWTAETQISRRQG